MCIKVTKNVITRIIQDFDVFTKLPKNVGDFDKLIVIKD